MQRSASIAMLFLTLTFVALTLAAPLEGDVARREDTRAHVLVKRQLEGGGQWPPKPKPFPSLPCNCVIPPCPCDSPSYPLPDGLPLE